jgi:precorrin-6B methylase 2
MGCHKLLKDVGAIVIEKYLNAENVLEYYLDAIKFDNEVVARACEMIILENLDTVMQTEQGSKFILNLPVKYMISICKNNRLRVSSENALA